MAQRLDLQVLLEDITEHVYYQQPTDTQMQYPCILYERDASWSEHADNRPYARMKRYQVTVVDRNPDSELPDIVEELRFCSFDRSFRADGLNHFVFNLFF